MYEYFERTRTLFANIYSRLTWQDFVVIATSILIVGVQLISNWFLFDPNYHLTRDYAATSIGAYEAATTGRVYGIPSWNDYYHPGSAWMYMQAVAYLLARPIAGSNLTPVGIALIARLMVNLIVFVSGWWAIRSAKNISVHLLLIIYSIVLAWLVASPVYLSSFWEPYIGATIYFLFLMLCISAATGRLWSLLASIVVGGICIQIQLSFLPVIILTSVISLILFYMQVKLSEWSRGIKIKIALLLVIAIVVGSWPMWYDLLINSHKNISDMLSYSDRNSNAPRLTIDEALSSADASLKVPGVAIVIAVGVSVMLLITFVMKTRMPNSDKEHCVITLPWVYGVLGFLGSFLFYYLLAKKTYAPPHSGAYGYVAAGIIFSGVISMCYSFIMGRMRHAIAITLAAMPSLALADTALADVNGLKLPVYVVTGIMYSPEMNKAVKEAIFLSKQKHVRLGVSAAFSPAGVNASDEVKEIPWAIAVDLANEMKRSGGKYCIVQQPRFEYASKVMKRFADTGFCGSEGNVMKARIKCENGKAVLLFNRESHPLIGCK